jgi:hypothetical protein
VIEPWNDRESLLHQGRRTGADAIDPAIIAAAMSDVPAVIEDALLQPVATMLIRHRVKRVRPGAG